MLILGEHEVRQYFGVEFWELSRKDRGDIQRYVYDCIRRTFIDEMKLPQTVEFERRRTQRARPLSLDNVRLGLQFSPDESEIIIRDIFEISVGGARCLYTGTYEIKEGAELYLIVIFLPNAVIQCRGRIVYVLREEKRSRL